MGKLYCDDFVLNQGFDSSEDYIAHWLELYKSPRFKGEYYYLSLFEEGLIAKGDVVSAHGRKKFRRCYEVGDEGNLSNILWRVYPLDKKICLPEEVFSRKRISRTWTVSDFVIFRDRFCKWEELSKE